MSAHHVQLDRASTPNGNTNGAGNGIAHGAGNGTTRLAALDLPDSVDQGRPVGPVDAPAAPDGDRLERAARDLLIGVGEDPERDGLLDTPARVRKSLEFLTQGYRRDPRDVSATPCSTSSTTRWCSSATSRCTASASTTCCPSSAGPTSATCRGARSSG